MNYDVVIIGASVAGCSAATLFARDGLKVALVDKVKDVESYKLHCTHYILAGAKPVMEKLGICNDIEALGGVPAHMNFWTRYGWIKSKSDSAHSYNLPRWKLDPLLRKLAQNTAGVDLFLETSFDTLQYANGNVCGVTLKNKDGNIVTLSANLVVGADGRQSKVAKQSKLKRVEKPHNRFINYAYYENLPLTSGQHAQTWYTDPDVGYCFPTAEGKTLAAAFISAEKYAMWKSDPVGNLEKFVGSLPGAPDFTGATRVSDVGAMRRMPNVRHTPASNGLALIGDAALSCDPVTGIGCSWAMLSASWLVESASTALKQNTPLEPSLARYRKVHAKNLNMHFNIISDEAQGMPFNPMHKLIFSAAAKDEKLAAQFHRYGNRDVGVFSFLIGQIPRSIWVNLTNKQSVDKENYSYVVSAE